MDVRVVVQIRLPGLPTPFHVNNCVPVVTSSASYQSAVYTGAHCAQQELLVLARIPYCIYFVAQNRATNYG
jgi:hypothetical protein